MTHVASLRKNRLLTPFQGVLPRSGLRLLAESGRVHPLFSGTWERWFAPCDSVSLHAPRCRGQRVQAGHRPSSAGCCHPPTTELEKTERGPISTSGPLISVWHQTGRSLRKNQSVYPRSPPLDRGPLARGWRRSTPVAPGLPPEWP
jgi:hypothetical protein